MNWIQVAQYVVLGSIENNKSCYDMSIYKYMLLKKDSVIWC